GSSSTRSSPRSPTKEPRPHERSTGLAMRGLHGKRVLVAGAATGIGAATARRLVEEGARVVLGDIEADLVEQVAHDLGAGWGHFDLHDPASITDLLAQATSQLGGLDGLANVAADLR